MLLFLSHEILGGLNNTKSFQDIFDLVQTAVKNYTGESRAGLNLGIMDMGNKGNQFMGAFYPVGSNIIVLNATPLKRIEETNPDLFRPYVFHVLLHEYLHSLGYMDEASVRALTHRICMETLGDSHPSTEMASNIEKFFPNLIYPGDRRGSGRMILIEDLDSGMDYVG